MDIVEYRQHFFDDAVPLVVLHNLRQISYLDAGRGLFYTSLRRALLSGNEFHQGCLAGTVLPYQTYLFGLADMEADVVEKGEAAERNGDVIDGNHFLQRRMDNSNSPYRGKARTNMENGSLGVMKAANIKMITNAYFLHCFN